MTSTLAFLPVSRTLSAVNIRGAQSSAPGASTHPTSQHAGTHAAPGRPGQPGHPSSTGGGSSASSASGRGVDRSHLANVRVIQHNLVYVIGLAPNLASEAMLRRDEYFGQYGKIVKVVVNRSHLRSQQGSGGGDGGSASAYITYQRRDDAKAAIQAVDGFWLGGNRPIR